MGSRANLGPVMMCLLINAASADAKSHGISMGVSCVWNRNALCAKGGANNWRYVAYDPPSGLCVMTRLVRIPCHMVRERGHE